MNKSKYLIIAAIVILFAGCVKDSLYSDTNILEITPEFKPELVDGRLVFKSQDDFDSYYKIIHDLDYKSRRDELMPFYQKGFTGLFPVLVLDKDDDLILEYKAKRIERDKDYIPAKGSSNGDGEMDQSDYLIADDDVAALFNVDREIVIANKAYIYFEGGIIRTSKNNANNLKSALKKHKKNGLVGVNSKMKCLQEQFEPMQDDDFEMLDCLPQNDVPGGGGRSSGGGGGSSSNPALTYGQGLEACWRYASAVGPIFGENFFCKSHWDNRHRVKTKVWNQNVLVAKTVGTNVRAQTRRFQIWWASDATGMHLGIDNLSFRTETNVPAAIGPTYIFKYNGFTYDQNGSLVTRFRHGDDLANLLWGLNSSELLEASVLLDGLVSFKDDIVKGLKTKAINEFLWKTAIDATKEAAWRGGANTVSLNSDPKNMVFYFTTEDDQMFITTLIGDYIAKYDSHEAKWSKGAVQIGTTVPIQGNFYQGVQIPFKFKDLELGKGIPTFDLLGANVWGAEQSGNSYLGDRLVFEP